MLKVTEIPIKAMYHAEYVVKFYCLIKRIQCENRSFQVQFFYLMKTSGNKTWILGCNMQFLNANNNLQKLWVFNEVASAFIL